MCKIKNKNWWFLVIVLGVLFNRCVAFAACGGCRDFVLVAPNGGENIMGGDNYSITWDNSQPCPNDSIDLDYSMDGGISYGHNIVAGLVDNGIYLWSVPSGINRNDIRIRGTGYCFFASTNDVSDADFSISDSGGFVGGGKLTDVLDNSIISHSSKHSIKYDVYSSSVVHNGSIKMSFANQFNLFSLTDGDVNLSGGDVAWGTPIINAVNREIVVPFSGDLNNLDGTLSAVLGNSNYIINPGTIGSYDIIWSIHATSDGSGLATERMRAQVAFTEGVNVEATIQPYLLFEVRGVGGGQSINGSVTNVVSGDNSIDFGSMNGAGNKIGAQDLLVTTNASHGYVVNLSYNHQLTDGINIVADFPFTNSSPGLWSSPGSGGIEGYIGYTTDDTTLNGLPIARFSTNKWSGLSLFGQEVMYHSGPSDGTTVNIGRNRVGYKLEITNFQASGSYSANVTYICTPSY